MVHIILFDSQKRHDNLLPLSFTRAIADFRVGILTIKEKWEIYAKRKGKVEVLPVDYLYLEKPEVGEDSVFVAGWILPDETFVEKVLNLNIGETVYDGDELVAFRGSMSEFEKIGFSRDGDFEPSPELKKITYVFDIFMMNHKGIVDDFRILTQGRKTAALPDSCTVIGPMRLADGTPSIFLEEGAIVNGAVINVTNGPVYIGRNAEIMECVAMRGPVAVCENSKLNIGAKVYGATTIGPWCKIGGEVNNIVVFGFSNKAHDGFIGNAVIGEWCNIGAGVNASNLKNDYSKIRLWNYPRRTFMRTDLQFCGLIMGDHSKAGINCMFNTATVCGVGVNLHGSGFPRTFIPSFSEGSPSGGFTDVSLDKFFVIAERVMARRGRILTEQDKEVFRHVYDVAALLKTHSR